MIIEKFEVRGFINCPMEVGPMYTAQEMCLTDHSKATLWLGDHNKYQTKKTFW